MEHPDKIRRITLPLSPLLHPGGEEPEKTKRLRPEDSLDLQYTVEQLQPSILATLDINGKPWSVIAVYSPYSPGIHVMVMETSTDRYLPGPESFQADEGDAAAAVMHSVVEFIYQQDTNDSVYMGYNWSPRSWGDYEEKGGFQSIPTKWHMMIWGWPEFTESEKDVPCSDWKSWAGLSEPAKRIFGDGAYIQAFSDLIAQRLHDTSPILRQCCSNVTYIGVGLQYELDCPLSEVAAQPAFFSDLLLPAGQEMDRLMIDLIETFTKDGCAEFDAILKKTEIGSLDYREIDFLRSPPRLRRLADIRTRFEKHAFPESLFSEIYEAVKKRADLDEDIFGRWRKGFGYSLVLGGRKDDNASIRILPGIYIGPGGVVEAREVILKRPINEVADRENLEVKSEKLWELSNFLKEKFPIYKIGSQKTK